MIIYFIKNPFKFSQKNVIINLVKEELTGRNISKDAWYGFLIIILKKYIYLIKK